MNIRSTLTGSIADFERCAGRCAIAAKTHEEDPMLVKYLNGASAAIHALLEMEFNDTEEQFINSVLNRYESTNQR